MQHADSSSADDKDRLELTERFRLNRLARRGATIFRREGLRGLWFHALAGFCYRRLLLLELVTGDDSGSAETLDDVEVGLLSPGDLGEYLALHQADGPAEVRRRLERGDICHCARHDGRIVSVVWSAKGSPVVRWVERTLALAPDEVYLYDFFTSREWRNRGILTRMVSMIACEHARSGVRRVLMAIVPENSASAKLLTNVGARPFARMGYIGPRGLRRSFFTRLGT